MPVKGQGQLLNRAEAAEFFGVALTTVDQLMRHGCPVERAAKRGEAHKFNSAELARWLREKAIEQATGQTTADETELKRRRLQAETGKSELEFAKARGDVAPIYEFERAQAKMMAVIRTNIMNVPARAVLQLLGETNEADFKAKLRAELILALEQSAAAEFEIDDDEVVEDDAE